MADIVQKRMEGMVPALTEMQKKKYFGLDEIKRIVRKRYDFEYRLARKDTLKSDVVEYIKYEIALEEEKKKKKKKKEKKTGKPPLSDVAGVMHIHGLFKRLTSKFKADVSTWHSWLDFCLRSGSTGKLQEVVSSALQWHPRDPPLYLLAAERELHLGHLQTARALILRGIRMGSGQGAGRPASGRTSVLWLEFLKLEFSIVFRLALTRKELFVRFRDSTVSPHVRGLQSLAGAVRGAVDGALESSRKGGEGGGFSSWREKASLRGASEGVQSGGGMVEEKDLMLGGLQVLLWRDGVLELADPAWCALPSPSSSDLDAEMGEEGSAQGRVEDVVRSCLRARSLAAWLGLIRLLVSVFLHWDVMGRDPRLVDKGEEEKEEDVGSGGGVDLFVLDSSGQDEGEEDEGDDGSFLSAKKDDLRGVPNLSGLFSLEETDEKELWGEARSSSSSSASPSSLSHSTSTRPGPTLFPSLFGRKANESRLLSLLRPSRTAWEKGEVVEMLRAASLCPHEASSSEKRKAAAKNKTDGEGESLPFSSSRSSSFSETALKDDPFAGSAILTEQRRVFSECAPLSVWVSALASVLREAEEEGEEASGQKEGESRGAASGLLGLKESGTKREAVCWEALLRCVAVLSSASLGSAEGEGQGGERENPVTGPLRASLRSAAAALLERRLKTLRERGAALNSQVSKPVPSSSLLSLQGPGAGAFSLRLLHLEWSQGLLEDAEGPSSTAVLQGRREGKGAVLGQRLAEIIRGSRGSECDSSEATRFIALAWASALGAPASSVTSQSSGPSGEITSALEALVLLLPLLKADGPSDVRRGSDFVVAKSLGRGGRAGALPESLSFFLHHALSRDFAPRALSRQRWSARVALLEGALHSSVGWAEAVATEVEKSAVGSVEQMAAPEFADALLQCWVLFEMLASLVSPEHLKRVEGLGAEAKAKCAMRVWSGYATFVRRAESLRVSLDVPAALSLRLLEMQEKMPVSANGRAGTETTRRGSGGGAEAVVLPQLAKAQVNGAVGKGGRRTGDSSSSSSESEDEEKKSGGAQRKARRAFGMGDVHDRSKKRAVGGGGSLSLVPSSPWPWGSLVEFRRRAHAALQSL
uniref:U3 small nucleolar RNA-associated protein 6 N-terminal domain-containing protein n=1 Tax=Chromera velia CCMP2878 TaxID=1169474 RepID=A0A0G4FZP8_9ALVE|eukprot:Cvel_19487.t1-p1 / transcript=Cvel_19487.t1 / gene=Cvel_19487 / organism=Chromera_velia_CCMP2878 / gene_product=U3 small nucleolar RNA-associated protein 6, putative / transcript_product=U3 small nucleolar RNA-associated protein 6, putative / location=Cvel_scaffold1684:7006-15091(+) / protein_length=1099 / sequence_SO=supercontig / SO=protein_coding / is_pseudo=false